MSSLQFSNVLSLITCSRCNLQYVGETCRKWNWTFDWHTKAVDRRCSIKKVLRPATLLKKTLAQMFSCEFCEISKNNFSYRTPPVVNTTSWCCGIVLIIAALVSFSGARTLILRRFNYRPVNLSVIVEVFVKLVNNRLVDHLEK